MNFNKQTNTLPDVGVGEIEDILYILDEFLGDTDPYLNNDMTDDDIKQEEPILWVHMRLIELRDKLTNKK